MAKTKIMVVEDEWIIANDIKDSLIEMKYMVTSIATSGEEAIRKAEEDRPDLILMDIVLKGEMDGIDAAKNIYDKLGIPIIYLTAYVNEYLVEKAKNSEHFGYLLKPFKDKELDIAINMAIHKAKKEK
ncbi:MAG: response regulator [Proteobacteria bacterium]|nr:response regulator [Pseudomonadota bacterium]MBU1717383.1 response regulator [Pseudomonadota bacterium]